MPEALESDDMPLHETPTESPERLTYYDRIRGDNLAPLWQVFSTLITTEPKSDCRSHIWRYKMLRDRLMEASNLISAKEAERRVLILENPGFAGEARITTSLFSGGQLVLPGEVAPAHRHSQSALRFIVEGSGGQTAVDGERTIMEEGDFVITPPWSWHDHGNDSDAPMIWLDGLDIPLVRFFDTSFAEGYSADEQPITTPDGDSGARYGANILPVDYRSSSPVSPLFAYSYARTREALEAMKQRDEWDPCHGLKMRYTNPNDGGHAMPTIGAFIQLLPKGFTSKRYRLTDATVFVCVEGKSKTWIGRTYLEWGPRDIIVAPSWHPVVHEASAESVLFSFPDRPVQEKLGLWRENRG
jgi:gentisate 1,2-dioxygenase